MSFVVGQGYGDMFGYTGVNARADGFEVKRLAGTVMRKAISDLVFTRFLEESQDAFGVGKGGTFTVPIFKDLGAVGTVSPLVSGTAIGLATQKTDSVQMMMYEYGTGISYEKILNWFTDINVQNQLTTSLSRHVARMVNWLDYDIFCNTPFSIEVPATGSYTTLLGTNRIVTQATLGELGPGGLALAYDSFKKNVVPPLTSRGLYGIVGNSETFRNLKQGSIFQNLNLYTSLNGQGINYQVLGEYAGFIFFETEELMGKGTSFAFGKNVGGYGFGALPQIWYYPDYGSDAGRLPVWKVLFYRGQGPIWRTKGTAAICIRSSSGAFNYGAIG